MGFKPQSDAASIVLVGDFNPPIFQPEWFRFHELIRESEARRLDEDEAETLSAGRFVEIIDNEWEAALAHARESSQTLLENVLEGDDQ